MTRIRPAAIIVLAAAVLPAAEKDAAPKTFESPEAAWKALLSTMESGEWKAMEALLGSAAAFIPPPARAPERLRNTARSLGKEPPRIEIQGAQATYFVEDRPFPVGARKGPAGAQKGAQGWVLVDNAAARAQQAALVSDLRCLSNLKTIARTAALFEIEKKALPPRLESLARKGESEVALEPAQLLCPLVAEGKHRAGADGLRCDYLYIPLKPGAPADRLLAFCPGKSHPAKGRACLFRDGSARKIESDDEFRAALKASLDQAGISVESEKPDDGVPEGSLAADAGWRKAIRAELGLEKAPAAASESAKKKAQAKKEPAKKAAADGTGEKGA